MICIPQFVTDFHSIETDFLKIVTDLWNREMYSIYKVQTFYWQRTFLVFLNGSVHERHLPNSSEFKSIKISVKTWKHFMLHHESILYSIRSVSKEDKINGILHDIEESPTLFLVKTLVRDIKKRILQFTNLKCCKMSLKSKNKA